MKVGICIPSRGDMDVGTGFDLAIMSAYDARFREGGELAIYSVAGTLIFDQREKLVQHALDGGCDYILFIDSDMRFPKNTIDRLLKHDKPIVGVNATTRTVPVKPTAKQLEVDVEKKENYWYPVISKGKTGIEQITAIGCGVMLVKAEVFRNTPQPWFWFYQIPGGKTLGEDVHFCVAAADAGYETWVDHDLSQEIGHVGQYTYGWKDVLIENGTDNIQRAKNKRSKLSRKK